MQTRLGKISIRVVEANLTRDTELFAKMDPYAKISCGAHSWTTRVHEKGGKKPKWNEVSGDVSDNYTLSMFYCFDHNNSNRFLKNRHSTWTLLERDNSRLPSMTKRSITTTLLGRQLSRLMSSSRRRRLTQCSLFSMAARLLAPSTL